MNSSSTLILPIAISAIFIVALKALYGALRSNRKHLPYPPGPKPKFLIGNTLDLPATNAGRIYAEWGKKFNSGIVHASALGSHIVVINKRAIADDLFEKRAKLYSDRPEIPVLKILDSDWNISLMKYGESWRQNRKLCQQSFHQGAAKLYQPIQTKKTHDFLLSLLQDPDRFFDHSKLLSVSITLSMMYGYEVKSLDDPAIHCGDESAMLTASLLLGGGTLINVMPFLRHIPPWVPGATTQKNAVEVRRLVKEMKRIPLEYVKKAMNDGTTSPSFVTNFLEEKSVSGMSATEEAIMHNVAYTTYGAAADTTISATGAFFHLIATHPEVQRKAQEEIDRVVGQDRLPNFSDRQLLPYIEAIYREVMRCSPPLHLGVPHALTEDDVYEGYFIPKGTTVMGNIWAMNNDEEFYPEPETFKPERFFDADGKLNDDSHILAYGFGRRVCVGKYVASSTLWLIIVSVLSCYNFNKAKDNFGNEIEIDGEYDDYGIICHKKPFKCSITPRSEHQRRLIEASDD